METIPDPPYDRGMNEVTRLLTAIEAGDERASEDLLPLVYEELRRLARRNIADERPGHTLQPTALVHEAYVRLVGSNDYEPRGWNSRGHFFSAAAEAMRRILVESARRKQRVRHGGELQRVPLDANEPVDADRSDEIVAVAEALDRLEEVDPVAAELVKLRYFAGMTLAEAASTLDLARRTADRTWAFAKAWLHRELQQ